VSKEERFQDKRTPHVVMHKKYLSKILSLGIDWSLVYEFASRMTNRFKFKNYEICFDGKRQVLCRKIGV